MKLLAIIFALSLMLAGCAEVINSPRDEIRQYGWVGEYENGNRAELYFDDGSAEFSVKNPDFSLKISGLCSLTDDSFVILNDKDYVSYEFEYVLHGDSIELAYHGDAIVLEKIVE